MLKNVPLFGVGNKGRSPNVNAQKRVNLYVEMQQDPEANGIVLYPTPGLSTFVNFGANPSAVLTARTTCCTWSTAARCGRLPATARPPAGARSPPRAAGWTSPTTACRC
jgi:hypothetical protein